MLAYAFVDRDVQYAGHSHLYVDGKELGPVPRLAICEGLDDERVMLFHCSATWTVLGAAGYATVMEAKQRAARVYRGVSWAKSDVSKRDATACLRKYWKGWECSLCRRRPDQVERIVQKKGVRICDVCVRELGEAIRRD